MSNKEYQKEVSSKTECVIRGAKEIRDSEPFLIDLEGNMQKRIYFGDSWFGSVKAAASMGNTGNHCMMAVKTAHGLYPKLFLEEKMKKVPGGKWMVMETREGRH